jgi:tetratricopeptide (TPR) repeat protein
LLLLFAWPLAGQASLEQAYAVLQAGNADKAIPLFQVVVRDNPDAIAPKVGLAKAFYQKRRMADTERLVEEILRLQPGNLEALYLKAKVEQRKNNLEVARNLLIEVVNNQPGNRQARQDLADILNSLGETELADRIYGELIE